MKTTTKLWKCSNCGISENNRCTWCDLGCGSDYHDMTEVVVGELKEIELMVNNEHSKLSCSEHSDATFKIDMEIEQIKELLKDKETFDKLKQIGIFRSEIWLLHRQINNLENETRVLETEIINKHKMSFGDLIGLSVMADKLYEEYLKNRD